MEMNYLPFKPKAIALAIATGILATQPVQTMAADSEWNCKPLGNGQWDCDAVPKGATPATPLIPSVKTVQTVAAVEQTKLEPSYNYLDWVPRSRLPQWRQDQLPYYACGAYVEPPRPGQHFSGDAEAAPIIAEADQSNYDESEIATLIGGVNIRQGSRQLKSDSAVLDRQTNYGAFEGNVVFRETGVLLRGDKGDLQVDSGRASLENTEYVLHEQNIRGSAGQIVRNEDGTLDLNRATYTTCAPGSTGWELSGDVVSLDQETGEGLARGAVVKIEGLPVFYSPILTFPLDDRRKSGFLYPTIGQDSDRGFDFSVPYYWNIAPNYDATITPRVMSKRGFMLENEFRYLVGNTEGELGVAGLANKDPHRDENPYYDQHRWLLNYRQNTRLTSRWTAEVDYSRASDKNYLTDFGSELSLSSRGPLDQRIGTRYEGGGDIHHWTARLDAHQFQNMSRTTDDPYNKLPQLELKGRWLPNNLIHFNYTADYTKFSRSDDWNYLHEEKVNGIYQSVYGEGYGIAKANGERMYFETGASMPFETSYGYLTPSLKVQHVQYQLSNLDRDEVIKDLEEAYKDTFRASDYTQSPKTTVPTFSVDSGMYFDRFTDIGESSFVHTLEPRMKYLYSPYVKGQEMNPVFDTAQLDFTYSSLWRDNRFSGYDRLGDANQLSLGITSRLIEDDGFERMRVGIGQTYYFRDRKLWINPLAGNDPFEEQDWDRNVADEEVRLREEMTDKASPLASELVYNINRAMSIRQDLMWSTGRNTLDSYGIYYGYRPGARKVLNVGYRYRDQVDRYVKDQNDINVPDPGNPDEYLKTGNNLSQTDISFAWPITSQWSALGRWQYDLTNHRNLELLSGVEYNSCCYQVRLMWRKWIDEDDNIDHSRSKSGIFLQFVLRGLGDLSGGSVGDYLDGIKGYAWDEK